MENKIIQEFQGEINGVVFDDKNIYYASQFILEKLKRNLEKYITKTLLKI